MTTLHDFDKTQTDILAQGGIVVAITPDDIITLKMLRDDYQRNFQFRNTETNTSGRRNRDFELTLQTLERILRQIH